MAGVVSFYFRFLHVFVWQKTTLELLHAEIRAAEKRLGQCELHLSCREPLKTPGDGIAASAKQEKEFAESSPGVVCALPGCLFQMYFPGEWRSEAA